MKNKLPIILFLLAVSSCVNLQIGTRDSNILVAEKNLPSPFLFSFPFNATTNINDSLYIILTKNELKAESYAKKYLPKGIEELRDKFGLYEWADTAKVNCIKKNFGDNESCRMDISSSWSKPITKDNSDHFTEMIPKLDPDYRPNYVYRFQLSIVIKVYVDNNTQLVHYDAMFFLNVQRKGSYASYDAFNLKENQIVKLNKINAKILDTTLNSVLYNYYLNWIKNELGYRKK